MVPKTPETRTPYVLALLAIIAAVNAALRWFVGFRYSAEVFVLVAATAIAYAVWRFVRERPEASLVVSEGGFYVNNERGIRRQGKHVGLPLKPMARVPDSVSLQEERDDYDADADGDSDFRPQSFPAFYVSILNKSAARHEKRLRRVAPR